MALWAGALLCPPTLAFADVGDCSLANVMPQFTKQECAGAPKCIEMHGFIENKASEYKNTVASVCSKVQSDVQSVKNVNQRTSQTKNASLLSDTSRSVGSIIDKAKEMQTGTLNQANQNLSELGKGNTRSDPAANSQLNNLRQQFRQAKNFEFSTLSASDVAKEQDTAKKPQLIALQHASEFIHNLHEDIKKREKTRQELDNQRALSERNAQNGGQQGDGKDSKGMDPSTLAGLAGPLAGLAGMAQQKNQSAASTDPTAASAISDPTASDASGASSGSAAADATPKSVNLGGSQTGSNPSASLAMQKGSDAPASGSPASPGGPASGDLTNSGLSVAGASPTYPDAFTGYGQYGNSTGSTGASSSGGAGLGGSGAGGEGESARTPSASSHAEEEALAAFSGGGGLNFGGGGSSSSSSSTSSTGDEPVKDFLQNAESTYGEDGPGETAAATEEATGEEDDGKELFRRVRAALERSQRKGAVTAGSSHPGS